MSDEPPRKPPPEATLDDLRPVDTEPVLSPVSTITLDEEPPPESKAPPPTLRLDPVPEAPPPRTQEAPRRLDVEANAVAPVARRRAALKADAFESFPALGTPAEQALQAERPASPREWSPGVIALAVMAAAVVALLAWVVFWG